MHRALLVRSPLNLSLHIVHNGHDPDNVITHPHGSRTKVLHEADIIFKRERTPSAHLRDRHLGGILIETSPGNTLGGRNGRLPLGIMMVARIQVMALVVDGRITPLDG